LLGCVSATTTTTIVPATDFFVGAGECIGEPVDGLAANNGGLKIFLFERRGKKI